MTLSKTDFMLSCLGWVVSLCWSESFYRQRSRCVRGAGVSRYLGQLQTTVHIWSVHEDWFSNTNIKKPKSPWQNRSNLPSDLTLSNWYQFCSMNNIFTFCNKKRLWVEKQGELCPKKSLCYVLFKVLHGFSCSTLFRYFVAIANCIIWFKHTMGIVALSGNAQCYIQEWSLGKSY